jgi:hypothetical protein
MFVWQKQVEGVWFAVGEFLNSTFAAALRYTRSVGFLASLEESAWWDSGKIGTE